MNYEEEQIAILRKHNRALRSVHKQLRRALNHVTSYSDELFLELCDSGNESDIAFEKLWALGRFDCGPKDYTYIVEHCLEAIRQVKPIGGSE